MGSRGGREGRWRGDVARGGSSFVGVGKTEQWGGGVVRS